MDILDIIAITQAAYIAAYNANVGKAGDNLKFALDCIGGLQVAHLCSTKKEAAELAEAWNAGYKANGTYLFDSPTF